MDSTRLTLEEVNKTALDHFIYQPVSREMISYLAAAAHNVIACDSSAMACTDGSRSLPPSPPSTPEDDDNSLPTVEEFITQLVVSSNVQVPTLMSTLVYLGRLKTKLQPMARGLRCTTHRIFLASLILSAKYLNDSSPKNKHWANYTHITTEYYSFGFSRTEVNLMEKQLLFLLEWDLRISEDDLYREMEVFLAPLRDQIVDRHNRKVRQREEKRRQKERQAAIPRLPSPASSRGHSRSRHPSPEQANSLRSTSVSPPGLSYSSSASSYSSSTASSPHHQSRSATPLDYETQPYFYDGTQASFYDSPVEIVMEPENMPKVRVVDVNPHSSKLLPYEISTREYHQIREEPQDKKRQKKGMWERLLGGAVAAR